MLTWDEETGEVREGLHDVVQERLELVREIDVVNDQIMLSWPAFWTELSRCGSLRPSP